MSSLSKKTKESTKFSNQAQQQATSTTTQAATQAATQNAMSTSDLTDWSKQQKATQEASILGDINAFKDTQMGPYDGERVAGLTGDQQTAREMTRTLNPREKVDYRTFDQFDPATYYNPYEKDVVDATGAYIDENLTKSIEDNSLRATTHGAYGGGRHGVADAELMRTAGMDKAKTMSDLRYKGHNDAADRFTADSDKLYTAGVRDSDAKYNDTVQKIGMLESLGASEQQVNQYRLLAEQAKYDEKAAQQLQQFQRALDTKLGFYKNTPMLTTNTSTGSSTNSSTGSSTTNSSGSNSASGEGSSTKKVSDPLGELSSLMDGIGSVTSTFGKLSKLGGT